MDEQIQTMRDDIGTITDSARDLMTATADVAGEKVSEARERLAVALEKGRQIYDRVREKAADAAQATDAAILEHPYQAVGIAFGAGALLGYLVSRRGSRNGG